MRVRRVERGGTCVLNEFCTTVSVPLIIFCGANHNFFYNLAREKKSEESSKMSSPDEHDAVKDKASNDVVVLNESDDEETEIPDRETCQKLTEEFAKITNTDEACAQFYLQDRNWDLERSINAFFEATQHTGVKALHDGDEPELVVKVNASMFEAYGMGQPTTKPPSKLSVISWNVDGLDGHNLKRRTKAVCKIIFQEQPDVVFLQEVIPETFRYISEKLPEYMCIQGNNVEYFTAVLLRRFTIYYDSHNIIPFSGSRMGRNLIHVKAHVGKLNLHFFNTHLESGIEFEDERKSQLKSLFEAVQKIPETESVIFGGDLNMRDKELDSLGGIPPGIDDIWKICGSRKECQYTWDMQRNTNKEFPGRFKPKCRFDRLYVRHAHPRALVPKHFGLLGIQKVIMTQSYPSDHWALQAFFQMEAA
ncbi:hypothetical protein R5R35_007776 [Gryllus longicercus]|uniref:Tyrosyl-DNA phosphodiesterase 2 n=1 Tax=Gryllus longicercus TaxID=2509291 RepID=A0AAN9W1I7_9ORTH